MKSQTINLLKKEITLGNSAQTLIWFICAIGMNFIPSYPVYVGPCYITLAIMMTFALNQSSHDILYTVLLPVRKIDTVKARFLYCGLLEVIVLLASLLIAILKHKLNFPQNKAGIDLTIAYFGLQMIVFAVFNFIFLGNVYKDPLKPGLRYLIAAIMYFVIYAICELPLWTYFHFRSLLADGQIDRLPVLAEIGLMLNATEGSYLTKQCIVLLAGLLIFAGSWWFTFRHAARQFENYDM